MKLLLTFTGLLLTLNLAVAQENKQPDKEAWREGETKFCKLVGMSDMPGILDQQKNTGAAVGFTFKPESNSKFIHPKNLDEIEKVCGKPLSVYDDGAKGKTYFYGRVGYLTTDRKKIEEIIVRYSIPDKK